MMEKMSTYDIIHRLSELEHSIDKNILEYNILLKELLKHFPTLEQQEEFKPKILTKKKYDI